MSLSKFSMRWSNDICDAEIFLRLSSSGVAGLSLILGVALLPCNLRVSVFTSFINCTVTSDASTAF